MASGSNNIKVTSNGRLSGIVALWRFNKIKLKCLICGPNLLESDWLKPTKCAESAVRG